MAPLSPNFTRICLVVVVVFAASGQCEKCIAENFHDHLGTKSPYRFVANINSTEVKYKGCEPVKLWGLVRHGTRNPNSKIIDKMNERLPEIRDEILTALKAPKDTVRNSDLEAFRKWTSKLEDRQEKHLTHEGEDEMLQLAERLQTRFPSILDAAYSNTSYKFKYTATQRTKKSAHYFAAGLFGRKTVRDVHYPEPLKRDPILRFYKLCSKWRKEVSKNPDFLVERRKFENSPAVGKLIKEINTRLAVKLDLSDIFTMYMVCAFETAWNRRKRSPWCSPFTLENFKVLEYMEDLKYYWVDGYGHPLTYKQACPAFSDMIEFFKDKKRFPKATVYFTHSGTLLKMLAHLELYKDENPLMADDFDKNSNRKWRVSQIDAFGTNLVFVLFNCDGRRKVLTLHQESVIRLPSCPNTDLCDIDKITKYYNESLESCDFDEMCDNIDTDESSN